MKTKKGFTLIELLAVIPYGSWYVSMSRFTSIDSRNPWIERGGSHSDSWSGIFSFYESSGYDEYATFRVVAA